MQSPGAGLELEDEDMMLDDGSDDEKERRVTRSTVAAPPRLVFVKQGAANDGGDSENESDYETETSADGGNSDQEGKRKAASNKKKKNTNNNRRRLDTEEDDASNNNNNDDDDDDNNSFAGNTLSNPKTVLKLLREKVDAEQLKFLNPSVLWGLGDVDTPKESRLRRAGVGRKKKIECMSQVEDKLRVSFKRKPNGTRPEVPDGSKILMPAKLMCAAKGKNLSRGSRRGKMNSALQELNAYLPFMDVPEIEKIPAMDAAVTFMQQLSEENERLRECILGKQQLNRSLEQLLPLKEEKEIPS